MNLLYFMCSAVVVVLSATALLTKRLKTWQYLFLLCYVVCMACVGSIYGQIIGIPTIVGLAVLILLFVQEYRVENACIACLGYLLNVTCNNLICLALVEILHISLVEFERRYWLPFCIIYALLLLLLMCLFRFLLYYKLNLVKYLEHISPAVRYGLFANTFLYGIIFFVTVSLGQKAGYSAASLKLNCVLFAVCMVVSGLLIVICAGSIRSEEQKRAEIRQSEISENYIHTLEQVLEELRAFKHDYKNIMAEMAGYIREGQIEQLKTYYARLTKTEEVDRYKDLYVWKSLRNIQSMEIKGLFYEKILDILGKNMDLKIKITGDLCVSYPDIQIITRMLGVFLDNAMEAALETEEKYISIEATGAKSGSAFRIENSCREEPDMAKIFRRGYSTKGRNRGMGLYWVQSILKEREELVHEMNVKDHIVVQKLYITHQ